MNQAQLTGNLARDPRVGYTSNNKAYAMFTVACSRTISMQDQEKELTDFIPCVAWGKLAERIAQDNTIAKGARVFVQGRLSVRAYEKDGQKKYQTQVVCEFFAKGLAGSSQATPPKPAAPGQSFNDMGTPTQEEIPF